LLFPVSYASYFLFFARFHLREIFPGWIFCFSPVEFFQGLTVKFKALEVPPAQSAFIEAVVVDDAALLPSLTGCDCGGLKTVTFTTAGAAKSAAVIIAFSWWSFTKVVGRVASFQVVTEVRWKWFPLTMSTSSGLPAAALLGAIEPIDGVSIQSPQERDPKLQAIITAQEQRWTASRESNMVNSLPPSWT
jgi:hypothetical protein